MRETWRSARKSLTKLPKSPESIAISDRGDGTSIEQPSLVIQLPYYPFRVFRRRREIQIRAQKFRK